MTKPIKSMNFKPMLSGKAPDDFAKLFPGTYLASPKLDGIRCVMIDGVPHSRNLTPIRNLYVRETLRGLPDFDGELIVGYPTGNDAINRTTSGVMSADGMPSFTYHIFDLWSHPGGFQERLSCAIRSSLKYDSFSDRLKPVKHILVSQPEHVKNFADRMVAKGYEGAMLRSLDGLYKFGRSTVKERGLLKVKFINDAEATIIGFTEMMHNANAQDRDELGRAKRSKKKAGLQPTGKLGNLVCDFGGIQFEIGTGLTEQQRVEMWSDRKALKGHQVTFTYQDVTPAGVPRFPSFKAIRLDA